MVKPELLRASRRVMVKNTASFFSKSNRASTGYRIEQRVGCSLSTPASSLELKSARCVFATTRSRTSAQAYEMARLAKLESRSSGRVSCRKSNLPSRWMIHPSATVLPATSSNLTGIQCPSSPEGKGIKLIDPSRNRGASSSETNTSLRTSGTPAAEDSKASGIGLQASNAILAS